MRDYDTKVIIIGWVLMSLGFALPIAHRLDWTHDAVVKAILLIFLSPVAVFVSMLVFLGIAIVFERFVLGRK